jgi:nitroreductase
MELFEAIKERYSYRGAFKDIAIPVDHLEQIVQAGLDAPSAGNRQTTQFVIITDPGIISDVKSAFGDHPYIATAPAFIAAIVDSKPKPYREGGFIFILEDCAAAIENILLSITALGYASVWLDGVLRMDGRTAKIGEAIGLPPSKKVQILLPVGVPQETLPRREKLPFKERAWFNRYGQ